ncbi:hypothetical protein CYMTET_50681 [Cymbomonas tetramitiformis]|uniref:Uncharacterized protein n=1 Tax=Cymbomonas tetramitiformis TaxID=36881 RepID=A0AAE0ESX2_9CHLO|nr:hypothetical protein CYMTET_50681 [Cymbomonas tetramitiformis]
MSSHGSSEDDSETSSAESEESDRQVERTGKKRSRSKDKSSKSDKVKKHKKHKKSKSEKLDKKQKKAKDKKKRKDKKKSRDEKKSSGPAGASQLSSFLASIDSTGAHIRPAGANQRGEREVEKHEIDELAPKETGRLAMQAARAGRRDSKKAVMEMRLDTGYVEIQEHDLMGGADEGDMMARHKAKKAAAALRAKQMLEKWRQTGERPG